MLRLYESETTLALFFGVADPNSDRDGSQNFKEVMSRQAHNGAIELARFVAKKQEVVSCMFFPVFSRHCQSSHSFIKVI